MKAPYGCFLPLNALAIHPHGEQKFCLTYNPNCEINPEQKNESFNDERLLIHSQLVKGNWPIGCRSCKNKEDKNIQSRRTRTWERKIARYGELEAIEDLNTQQLSKIRHLEITFSNNCNIACAMCSSEFSTSWISLDKQAVKEGLDFRNFTIPFQTKSSLSQSSVDSILEHADEFELVIIKGGEPTFEPLCLEFLERLNEKTILKKPLIFIQTNGTRQPSQWIPKNVTFPFEVGFSLDGWGECGEWIRGTNFDNVLKNFQEVSLHSAVKTITIDFTLSLYNVFHLPDFFEKILILKQTTPKLTECAVFQWVQQHYASPLVISLESRLKIRDRLIKIFNQNAAFFLNYENLLNVLALPQLEKDEIRKAILWTEYVNKKRKHSIYDIQPEIKKDFYSNE